MTDLDDLDAYIIHVAELQAIIERLREEKQAVLLHVVDLRAEIERLQRRINTLEGMLGEANIAVPDF